MNRPKRPTRRPHKRDKSIETKAVRLQKFIAHCGVASRRAAEGLIESGKVKVNGKLIRTLGSSVDPTRDKVEVNGKLLRVAERGILLFNKPVHVVSTMNDPEGRPCIADYLTSRYRSYYPVGRLDFESSGLMILTNDGDLAEHLMHPRYGMKRVYRVKVSGRVPDAVFERVERGVMLDDGEIKGSIEGVEQNRDATSFHISIGEGRNRIIRRLFDHLGYPVQNLVRIKHGPFSLSHLKSGQLKKIPYQEYVRLRRKLLNKL